MGALGQFWHNFVTALWNGLPKADDLALFLLRLAELLVIGALTLWLARRVKGWAARLLGRSRIAPNVIALLGNVVFVLIVLLGVSWLLSTFGASWTALLTSLGVLTVALSLSLQDVLKNFVSGVYLLVEQPFSIGDQVVVKGVAGEVQGIDIRTTILRTEEGLQVLVPNNVVFTEVLTNRSAYDTRRVVLNLEDVRVEFGSLSRLVNEALEPFPSIAHTPAPKVTIHKVAGETATIGIEYWQRGHAAILPEVLARLRGAFPGANITVTTDAT